MQDSGQLMSNYSSPPNPFAPGASLTSNSTGGQHVHGRNGAQNPLQTVQEDTEIWPMKTFANTSIPNNTR